MSVRTFAVIAAVSCASAATLAGDPTPPAGPVAPTMKTLDEVEPRIALNATNTPGDADSVFRIAQPGSYYLSEQLDVPSGRHGIEIAASNVSIDLEGYTIDGTTGSLNGISIDGARNGIIILNGHIFGMDGSGIAGSLRYGLIEDIQIRACDGYGIDVLSSVIISNCVVRTTVLGGIRVAASTLIKDTDISQVTGGNGIEGTFGTRVVGCTIFDADNHGIVVGEESQVSNCNVRLSGGNGVVVGFRCTVSDTIVAQSGQWGIELEFGSVASRCLVEQSVATGIVGRLSTKIEHCNVLGNGANGIYVEDDSSVIGNTVRSNGVGAPATYGGIVVPLTGCTVRDNDMSGNGTNLIVTGAGNSIVRNASYAGITAGYSIGGGNFAGALVSNPALAGPWDNLDN